MITFWFRNILWFSVNSMVKGEEVHSKGKSSSVSFLFDFTFFWLRILLSPRGWKYFLKANDVLFHVKRQQTFRLNNKCHFRQKEYKNFFIFSIFRTSTSRGLFCRWKFLRYFYEHCYCVFFFRNRKPEEK